MKVSPLRDDRSVDEHTCKLSRHLSETRRCNFMVEWTTLRPNGEARRLVTSDIKRPECNHAESYRNSFPNLRNNRQIWWTWVMFYLREWYILMLWVRMNVCLSFSWADHSEKSKVSILSYINSPTSTPTSKSKSL